MPTYKAVSNLGADVHFVQNGVAYTAPGDGSPLVISEILNPVPAGIIQINQQPVASPIIASWSTTATGNFPIPTGLTGRYRVLLFCVSGAFSITFNGNGGQPLLMGATMQWDRICQVRVIDVINVTETSAGTLLINIESY